MHSHELQAVETRPLSAALAGMVVLITGASSGLGLAMAKAVLQQGATVIGISHDQHSSNDALRGFAEDQGRARHLVAVTCDVTDREKLARLIGELLGKFGAIDAVVNNAGLSMDAVRRNYLSQPLRFWDVPPADWERIMQVNTIAPQMVAAITVPAMIKKGWGRVVNVSTTYASMQRVGFSPYGPSKAALEAATVIWAQELKDTGVTANVILPGGAAATYMTSGDPLFANRTLIDPAMMGPPLCWLLSRDADGITGQRFVAKHWDPSQPQAAAVARSIAPAGFLTTQI